VLNHFAGTAASTTTGDIYASIPYTYTVN